MFPNEGVTEHAHTHRYVPVQKNGPFLGLKDKLHFYNKNWPYPANVEPEVKPHEPKDTLYKKGLRKIFNPNWPYPAPKP